MTTTATKPAQIPQLRLADATRNSAKTAFFDRVMVHVETKDRETYTLSKTTVWLVPIIIGLLGVAFTIFANYGAFVRADETKSGDIRLLVEKIGALSTKFDTFQSDSKIEAKDTKIELKLEIQTLQSKVNQLEQRLVSNETKINNLDRRGGL